MSAPNVDNANLRDCTKYCLDSIRTIIERFGPRPPGSDGERKCQEFLKEELAGMGLSPEIEAFPVAQKAFIAMPMVAALLALCSLPLYWFAPLVSPVPVLLAMVIFVCELFFYKHVLSLVFPKSTSYNLSASLAPSGEKRRRIILCGHADAAYEWNFNRLFPGFFPLFPILTVLSVSYVLLSTLAIAIMGGDAFGESAIWFNLGLGQFAALPGLMIGVLFTNFNVSAPGAGDNLSGSLAVVGLARLLHMENTVPENTEIVFLVTGSEEAGLEGAKAYVKAHQEEWKDVETICIAYDTLCEMEHFAVHVRDLNGRVRHDPRVCALAREAGKDCGLDLPDAVVEIGSSDGTAFTQAGIPTTALCAMDHAPAHYYHNRRDDCSVLSEECTMQTLRLSVAMAERYDREGLPDVS